MHCQILRKHGLAILAFRRSLTSRFCYLLKNEEAGLKDAVKFILNDEMRAECPMLRKCIFITILILKELNYEKDRFIICFSRYAVSGFQ